MQELRSNNKNEWKCQTFEMYDVSIIHIISYHVVVSFTLSSSSLLLVNQTETFFSLEKNGQSLHDDLNECECEYKKQNEQTNENLVHHHQNISRIMK